MPPSLADSRRDHAWSCGDRAIAPSGGTFLRGAEWGAYDGLLLIGVQRATGVLALWLDEQGQLVAQSASRNSRTPTVASAPRSWARTARST